MKEIYLSAYYSLNGQDARNRYHVAFVIYVADADSPCDRHTKMLEAMMREHNSMVEQKKFNSNRVSSVRELAFLGAVRLD